MTKDEKTKLVNQIMTVLDYLSEDYLIHRPPLIKKSDNIEPGWGGNGKRKMTFNVVFQIEKPTRKEVELRVRSYVDLMSGERL